jgi:hypothetical protein
MEETAKPKLFRDPVYGFIRVDRTLVLPLVSCPEFQRLRRIRQLGFSHTTYHGAEHTRFAHSLGVMHLFNRVAQHLQEIGKPLKEEEFCVGHTAALLHDIGHGPFSHVLEGQLVPQKHEHWTGQIILGKTEIANVLRDVAPDFPEKVWSVIKGDPKSKLISSLISSQLDVDRMDYLLRDALMTGTSYGQFDLDRLIEMLDVANEGVIVRRKGLHAVEQFVFARYYAYWQIYFHRTTRGMEKLVQAVWKRAKELFHQNKLQRLELVSTLVPFLGGKEDVTLKDYLAVDDTDFWNAFKVWSIEDDQVLSDLASRVISRKIFKWVDVPPAPKSAFWNKVQKVLVEHGFDPTYYLLEDSTSDVPYDYYIQEEEQTKPGIVCEGEDGSLRELSKVSEPIKAIAGKRTVKVSIFVPDECRAEIARLAV